MTNKNVFKGILKVCYMAYERYIEGVLYLQVVLKRLIKGMFKIFS